MAALRWSRFGWPLACLRANHRRQLPLTFPCSINLGMRLQNCFFYSSNMLGEVHRRECFEENFDWWKCPQKLGCFLQSDIPKNQAKHVRVPDGNLSRSEIFEPSLHVDRSQSINSALCTRVGVQIPRTGKSDCQPAAVSDVGNHRRRG